MKVVKWLKAERSGVPGPTRALAVQAVVGGSAGVSSMLGWGGVRTNGWGYRSRDRSVPSMTSQNWVPPTWANSSLPQWIPSLVSVELKDQAVPRGGELRALQI